MGTDGNKAQEFNRRKVQVLVQFCYGKQLSGTVHTVSVKKLLEM
jgi:hypothetical protein